MRFDAGPDDLINLASGLLLIGLALFVLTLRPRNPVANRFGLFAAFFGLRFVLVNLDEIVLEVPDAVPLLLGGAAGTAFVVAAWFLWSFSLRFPSAMPGQGRGRLLFPPLALAGVFFLYLSIDLDYMSVRAAVAGGLSVGIALGLVANVIGYTVMISSLWGVSLLYALRYRSTNDPGERRQYALMAAALVIWPAFENAYHGPGRAADGLIVYWVGTGVLALLAASWLANDRPPEAWRARSVALVALGAGLAGALYGLILSPGLLGEGGLGLSRFLGVAILSYAILRHRVLGLDVRVRWALSKTTVAAVFIAVFFIASEAAQQFFGDALGGPYIGIIAAGLLVFAMAPLQRLTDHLAAKAVPLGARPVDDEAAYRVALRKFLVDGVVSKEEERHLARLATRCGVSAERALAMREEVEAELEPGPGRGPARGRP